jgi:hypothetical protein
MTTSTQVLQMLIPQGGWATIGNDYEGIQFLECKPITKAEFQLGLTEFDDWKAKQEATKVAEKVALLAKLGITDDEAKLLLS